MLPELKIGGITTPATLVNRVSIFDAPTPYSSATATDLLKAPETSGQGATPTSQYDKPIGPTKPVVVPPAVKTSLPPVDTSAAKIQKKAAELTKQQDTGTSAFVSSSAPVVTAEKNITSTVKDMMSAITPPAEGISSAQIASDAYQKMLDDQMAALEKRRADEVARIESQFAGAKAGLETTQAKETGTTAVGISRMGGYLGPSGSGTGVMLNLAATHKTEIATLEAKKSDAIQQANNAISDKQFALAQMKVKEVKDIEQTINDRKNKFFDQSLNAIDESRKQEEGYRTKIKDDLEMLGKLGSAQGELKLDPMKAAEIDQFYGVKGFTKQYLDVVNATARAKSLKDTTDSQKNLLDLLEKIPSGQKVKFPDGTEYTGLGSAGDIYTTLETDSSGIGRMVTYDKRTGKINVTNVGAVGKPSDKINAAKSAALEESFTSTLQIQLESEKMPNGSYDPDTYIRERKLIAEASPELLSKLDAKFLNPSNGFFTTDAINQLRKKGVYAATPSL